MSDYWSGQKVYAGFATKTDFNSIIDATVKQEKYRYNQLSKQKEEINFKKEQLTGLNRTLLTYKTELAKMDTVDEFLVKKATSSKTDVVGTKVSAGAADGVHRLDVKELATVASTTSNELNEVVHTGADTDMTFDYDGTTYTVNVKQDMTAKELASAITAASGGKIKASMIDLGHDSKFKVQLRGMDLGAGHNITLSTELETVLKGTEPAVALSSEASKNSRFILDGIELQRSTNTISDATDGITYSLNSIEDGVVVTVETDFDAIVANVEKFVKLTNELRSGIALVQNYKNEELDKKNVNYSLKSSTQIRSVKSELSNILVTEAAGLENSSYASLSQIGIRTNFLSGSKDMGKLQFDKNEPILKLTIKLQSGVKLPTTTFMDVLKADPEGVAKLFTASGEGTSSDSSVLDYQSSLYSFGITKPGTYKIEYDSADLPTTGPESIVSMQVNGTTRSVKYNPATGDATIDEGQGDGQGLAFKVRDTSAGTHSATISIQEGLIQTTKKALDRITADKTGTFEVVIDRYTEQLTDPVYGLDKKMADELARVKALEKRLIAKYAKTEKTLSTYQNIQKMLDFQLKSQVAEKK
ncbi:flagellar filament capping protein FliD [Halodesulfovibrio spirochaetisodalis]|uniref:Flagellar hook-associated protein 2 n=1 Tax=Halodesulfovibrio spirochaetisodalis TaxID=1560234 RepID=A0A1B7XQ77_9BACT|nr:flagellar filament capping protein FliD [Halodesulfovibrio spirochaetisodalis]OBQ57674.1 hypothetical protein SP90_01185 [Halodesulfovibrio spirochaetisodalis]